MHGVSAGLFRRHEPSDCEDQWRRPKREYRQVKHYAGRRSPGELTKHVPLHQPLPAPRAIRLDPYSRCDNARQLPYVLQQCVPAAWRCPVREQQPDTHHAKCILECRSKAVVRPWSARVPANLLALAAQSGGIRSQRTHFLLITQGLTVSCAR